MNKDELIEFYESILREIPKKKLSKLFDKYMERVETGMFKQHIDNKK